MVAFRTIVHRPQWADGADLPRHRHLEAYATIVLDGAYEQLAYAGRLRPTAGEVLIQPTLDAHADRMISPRLRLLRLPWGREEGLGGVFRIQGLDLVIRAAERDAREASALLAERLHGLRPAPPVVADVADELAADIRADTGLRIGAWSARRGLLRETVARRFQRAYGVPPARFRGEHRARQAWLRATGGDEPLARVAAELGFADQAHMTRAVRAISGEAPSTWRRRLRAA